MNRGEENEHVAPEKGEVPRRGVLEARKERVEGRVTWRVVEVAKEGPALERVRVRVKLSPAITETGEAPKETVRALFPVGNSETMS